MDYRIKMEPISEKGQEKLSDDLRNGIECKGFIGSCPGCAR